MSTFYFPLPVSFDPEREPYGVDGYEVAKTEDGKEDAVRAGGKLFADDELAEAWTHARKLAGSGATYTALPTGEAQGAWKKQR